MTETIELSSALRRLPLEAPPHSVWPAVQAQLPKRPAWPTWPAAAAAAAVLLAVLFQFTGQPPATGTPAGALEPLMARSAQLESAFYAQQDDAISSASVIAANLNLEEQLAAIDTELGTQPATARAEALWRQRIELLDQGIRLNRDNADYNARGQSFDLALASTD
jgi:hypothetical protein